MKVRGIVGDCKTFPENVTSFYLESNPSRYFFARGVSLPLYNGQFVMGKTVVDKPKPEERILNLESLDVFDRENGKLLHQYVKEMFCGPE